MIGIGAILFPLIAKMTNIKKWIWEYPVAAITYNPWHPIFGLIGATCVLGLGIYTYYKTNGKIWHFIPIGAVAIVYDFILLWMVINTYGLSIFKNPLSLLGF